MFQRFFDEGLAQASFFLACPRGARSHRHRSPPRRRCLRRAGARPGFPDRLLDRDARPRRLRVRLPRAARRRRAHAVGPGSNLRYAHHEVQDGERIRVGDLSMQFMHTPGHTPEHISILVSQPDQPTRIFTGDTLFAGAVGRPDLLGEEMTRKLAGQLHDSLFNKLLALDDRIEVHPGHGAGSLCGAGISSAPFTTIGQERRFNKMLQHAERDAFVAAVLADLPETPPYFPRMKKLNQEGPPLLGLVNGYRGPAPISASATAAADQERRAPDRPARRPGLRRAAPARRAESRLRQQGRLLGWLRAAVRCPCRAARRRRAAGAGRRPPVDSHRRVPHRRLSLGWNACVGRGGIADGWHQPRHAPRTCTPRWPSARPP